MNAQEWQPIETAPKDGTEIVLFEQTFGICIGSYGDFFGRFHLQYDNDNPPVVNWTHWMPLPAPPEKQP